MHNHQTIITYVTCYSTKGNRILFISNPIHLVHFMVKILFYGSNIDDVTVGTPLDLLNLI